MIIFFCAMLLFLVQPAAHSMDLIKRLEYLNKDDDNDNVSLASDSTELEGDADKENISVRHKKNFMIEEPHQMRMPLKTRFFNFVQAVLRR